MLYGLLAFNLIAAVSRPGDQLELEVNQKKMLRFLSQRRRSRNIILIGFCGLMVLSLITFFSVPNNRLFGSGVIARDTSVLAEVDGREITVADFKDRLQLFAGRGGSLQDPATLMSLRMRGVDKTVLDGLIQQKIMEIEAERLGLTATLDELRERIRRNFSEDGKFIGEEKYKRALVRNGQNWQSYEKALSQSITLEKLRGLITSAVQVSPQEVEEDYKRKNTSVDLTYVVVQPGDVRDKVTLSDEELRSYFEKNKEKFRINANQRQVDYLFISQERVGKTVDVSDEELKKRYDSTDQITEARVARIMLRVLTPADDDTVRQKAQELVNRAKGIGSGKAEDFAALARGNSQDTTTAKKGGEVGWVKRDRNRPNDHLQRAFSMNVGEISDPIKDGSNYYIIKVLDKKKQTFEEARASLLVSARNDLSYKKASQIADEARQMFLNLKDIHKVAAEMNKKLNVPEDSKEKIVEVRRTPFFSEGDSIPDIGSMQAFEEATAALKNKGDIGVKLGVPGGFAIPQLVDTRGPHDAEFEEVKSKVELEAKNDKAAQVAEQRARELASGASSPDALKSAAEAAGFKVETRDGFKQGFGLTGVDISPKLDAAIFALKEGEVTRQPVKVKDKFVVAAVKKRTEANLEEFNKQRDSLTESFLASKRNLFFESYLSGIRKRLEEAGRIKIHEDVLAKVFGDLGEESAP